MTSSLLLTWIGVLTRRSLPTFGAVVVAVAVVFGMGAVTALGADPPGPQVVLDVQASPLVGTTTLTASVTVPPGTGVTSVSFEMSQAGGVWQLVATDSVAPYTAALATTALADGNIDLRASATLSDGLTTTSPIVTREIKNTREPPTVSLDAPDPLSGVVPLTANAKAGGGAVISVAFQYAPGNTDEWTTISIDSAEPFTASFDTLSVPPGPVRMRAVATDSDGLRGTSPVLARTVANEVGTAPVVVLQDPGSRLTGIVPINATVKAAPGRTIVSVTFQTSPADADVWTTLRTDLTFPYNATLSTTAFAEGLWDIRAVATDSDGESGASPVLQDRLITRTGTQVRLVDPGDPLRATVRLVAEINLPPATPPTSVSFERSPHGARDWTVVGTATAPPFEANDNTTTIPDGAYDYRVVVGYGVGRSATSPTLEGRRVDNTAPTAALAAVGSTLSGRVTLGATADDGEGSGVESIRFERSAKGAGVWSRIARDSEPPYLAGFDTRLLVNGVYDLRVTVVDRAGNAAESATVSDITIENGIIARPPPPSVETLVPPASGIKLLGTEQTPTGPVTWALGFTSAAPATVDGERLPYTALGDQLVLVRFADGQGWKIVDVLRQPDGTPFRMTRPSELPPGSFRVTGSMAKNGEAWVWLTQRTEQAGYETFGLFHRPADGRFELDVDATDDLGSGLLLPEGAGFSSGSLRVIERPEGGASGILVSPGQATAEREIDQPGGASPITVTTALRFAMLKGDRWDVRTASLPKAYVPCSGDRVALEVADISRAGEGWGALEANGSCVGKSRRLPLFLGSFSAEAEGWKYVQTGIDALDLGDAFAIPSAAVRPTALRIGAGELWVGASVFGVGDRTGEVVARLDAETGDRTTAWCDVPRRSTTCDQGISTEVPAVVPDAIFEASGVVEAVGVQPGFVHVFRAGEWERRAAPGFGPDGGAAFTSPSEGWLVGIAALGRWTQTPTPPRLVTWPQANRTPLTSIALPASSTAGLDEPGALAVGLDGTALRFNPLTGWQVTPLPPRASHVNMLDVAFSNPSSAVAVGQFGMIIRWDGSTWTEDPQAVSLTQAQLNAVVFAPSGDGWAVGTFGTILHFDGSTWSVENPPVEDDGLNITSVAVAGDEILAVAGGNLISRNADGSWQRVAADRLPSEPSLPENDLRLVRGLQDGSAVVAGRFTLIVRDGQDGPFTYSAQPLEGIAVALAAFRDKEGELRSLVSIAPPARDPNAPERRDVAGYPAGDGELLRQTSDGGWVDLSMAQYGGANLPTDGAVKADPVLAIAADPTGERAWAVGGYAGTITSAGQGTASVLAARPVGWRTSSIWRYDAAGSSLPPGFEAKTTSLPAKSGTIRFAFFSNATCRWQCAETVSAQPDVNLQGAATQIATFAKEPGGPAFALLGGNARGPSDDVAFARGNGAADFIRLPELFTPLGALPLFAAFGQRDNVPTAVDPKSAWADALSTAPAPLGSAPPSPGITPVSTGPTSGSARTVYSFDASQNGATARVIVLDNSAGSLETSVPGQAAWLEQQLDAARRDGIATVVAAERPLREGGATDGNIVAARLARAGVLAVFSASDLNETHQVPDNAAAGEPQVTEFEGGALGYQQTANNGVSWFLASIDTRTRSVGVQAIPIIESLTIKPLQGLSVPRSGTLEFQAVARRPLGTLATTPAVEGFPGFDNYVTIPAASCGTRPCLQPTYTFTSSDPTIGNFVVPSAAGSRYPRLDAAGAASLSATSGLFCGFNTGSTVVTVTVGLLTYSLPVQVGEGGFGPPCGTVFRAGVRPILIVKQQQQATDAGGAGVAPPPAAAPTQVEPVLPPLAVPAPAPPVVPVAPPVVQPAPIPVFQPPTQPASPAPVPVPTTDPVTPVSVVPPPVPPVQPVPPGGAVAQSPAAAPRKEKARKHASQSAFTIRPAGEHGEMWFFGVVGTAALGSLLLAAYALAPGGSARGRRSVPAYIGSRREVGTGRPSRPF